MNTVYASTSASTAVDDDGHIQYLQIFQLDELSFSGR